MTEASSDESVPSQSQKKEISSEKAAIFWCFLDPVKPTNNVNVKGTCMDEMPHFNTKFRPQSWTRIELRCNEKMVMKMMKVPFFKGR